MHKVAVTKIPEAKAGREDISRQIVGMQGVPQEMIHEWLLVHRGVSVAEEPALKKQRLAGSYNPYLQAAATVPGLQRPYPHAAVPVPAAQYGVVPMGYPPVGYPPVYPPQHAHVGHAAMPPHPMHMPQMQQAQPGMMPPPAHAQQPPHAQVQTQAQAQGPGVPSQHSTPGSSAVTPTMSASSSRPASASSHQSPVAVAAEAPRVSPKQELLKPLGAAATGVAAKKKSVVVVFGAAESPEEVRAKLARYQVAAAA
ncbi:MAG: hypothetical protein MHM6MM_003633 [Cercozoa sp. M6MM]